MRNAILAAVVGLSGCAAVYTSPDVRAVGPGDGTGYSVDIIAMTPQAIAIANAEHYTPRRAPKFAATDIRAQAANAGKPASASFPADTPPEPYRIGVSDVVSMALATYGTGVADMVAGAPVDPRAQAYTVQDDNAIAIPNVGRITIAGLTLAEAEEKIFHALVEKQLDPGFSLDIAQFNARSVVVGGYVRAPGPLPITLKPLNLGAALQLAGGPLVNAGDVTQVRLLRGPEEYVMPLRDALAAPGQGVRLRDRDVILVERLVDAAHELERQRVALQEVQLRDQIGALARDYIYITGEARKPERFALPFDRRASLADILFESGGIAIRSGDYRRIYVLRLRGLRQVAAYHLDAGNAANLVASQVFEMRPNDIVFVAEQPVTAWNRTISQLFPSIVVQAAAQVN